MRGKDSPIVLPSGPFCGHQLCDPATIWSGQLLHNTITVIRLVIRHNSYSAPLNQRERGRGIAMAGLFDLTGKVVLAAGEALDLLGEQSGGRNLWERMWIASELRALDS